MIRTETVLDSWKTVRHDTAQTVEDFPAAELDFKPVGEVMTFREIARHILEAGDALTGLLLDGVENMATPQFRESLLKYIGELPQTPDSFAHVITRFDGQRVTRLEMVQLTKEHELTHRAQLFLYSRLKGIVPV